MSRVVSMALSCLLALSVATGFAVAALAPQRPVSMSYQTLEEVRSLSYIEAELAARTRPGVIAVPVLGSSELGPRSCSSTHPVTLLGDGRYGVSVQGIGRAFCGNLWQAIEVGALAPALDGPRRVVLIPSIQWFMCYRDPVTAFPAAFSQSAYDACMRNSSLPSALKERIRARMAEYGVSRGGPSALDGQLDAIDRRVREAVGRLRTSVAQGGGPLPQRGPLADAPDWDALLSRAQAEAAEKSSGNDLGVYNGWYAKNLEPWLAGTRAWESQTKRDGYFSDQEFQDFDLLLSVCREAGVEPLVLIQPVKGALYDRTVYTRQVRAGYYDAIRSSCERAGVAVADFSDREYDPLFLREYSHPSALGAAWYSRAIYDFATTGRLRPGVLRAGEGSGR